MTIFTPFKFTLFSFSIITISLGIYFSFHDVFIETRGFETFLKLFTTVFIYIFIKYLIDIFLANVFAIEENVNYFLQVKYGYLFTSCLLIFPVIIISKFAFNNNYLLIFSFVILLIFRAVLVLFNNKGLIIGKLFYFILYFCIFEIAPLLILYKTTTQ